MFHNREEAGTLLAAKLIPIASTDAVLFAITRGGIVVGRILADTLKIPLNAIVVKKLRSVHNPELAIGAILSDGTKFIDWELALRTGIDQEYLDTEIETRKKEASDLEKKYHIKLPFRKKQDTQIILADDGIATGATVQAAIRWIKEKISDTIIIAVPVIAEDTYNQLQSEVKRIVAIEIAQQFSAVGQFYEEFPQVTDEEVIKLL